jgi:NADH:ubiquinone oxidoreductase subunit 2 (subunit N)
MIYGATGSLELSGVFQAISSGHIRHQVLVLGVVFVVCGIAFKLAQPLFTCGCQTFTKVRLQR